MKQKEIAVKNWESGLRMEANWRYQLLHPEQAEAEWLGLVQASFHSRIMMPLTSYIVVENEAQKAILKRKKKQLLNGKRSLDPGDDMTRMSEPGLLPLLFLFGLFLIWQRKRRAATGGGN